MNRRKHLRMLTGLAAVTGLDRIAYAQSEWKPSRPIRLVIPQVPGGPMDNFGRAIGERLSRAIGQPVVMDYKPGGGFVIAAEHVVRQPPDGLTLFLTSSTFSTNTLLSKVSYDPQLDFIPVIHLADIDVVVAVNSKMVDARTPQELLAWARQNPAKAFFALPVKGGTGHLLGELINKRASLSMQPVFYRGSAPMMLDVIGGQVPLVIETIATLREFARQGTVALIASSGANRIAGYSSVPTLHESILPGVVYSAWYCIHMPAKAPPEIVARLNREFNLIVKDPAVASLFQQGGATIRGGSPEEAARTVAERHRLTAQIIREANIKVD